MLKQCVRPPLPPLAIHNNKHRTGGSRHLDFPTYTNLSLHNDHLIMNAIIETQRRYLEIDVSKVDISKSLRALDKHDVARLTFLSPNRIWSVRYHSKKRDHGRIPFTVTTSSSETLTQQALHLVYQTLKFTLLNHN